MSPPGGRTERTLVLAHRRLNASVPKVVTLPQQRFTPVDRERIREAIAEVQACGMAAAFPEISVGLACQAGLALGYRLNDEPSFFDEFVQRPADYWVTESR